MVNALYFSPIDFPGKFFLHGPAFSERIFHDHLPGPSDKLLDKVPGFPINIAYFVLSAHKDWPSFIFLFLWFSFIPEACFKYYCISFDTQRSAWGQFIKHI